MGQAIVDPQELRRFAARLRHFSAEVMTQMQTFGRFVEATGDYVPYLIRKAERVEEYQQQR